MTTTRHFIVSGRVQGVGFRHGTRVMAEQLELSGWVKNLPGGEVEVVAVGDPKNLAEFETWLWAGPSHARVTGVAATTMESGMKSGVKPEPDAAGGFHIRV